MVDLFIFHSSKLLFCSLGLPFKHLQFSWLRRGNLMWKT
jgi:hypothetical protein